MREASGAGGYIAIVAVVVATLPLLRHGTAPMESVSSVTATEKPATTSAGDGLAVDDYCAERFASPFQRKSGARASAYVERAANSPQVAWERRLETAKLALCDGDPETRLESFVALVPDPVESGLTYAFHSHMRGVQTGMEVDLEADSVVRDESWIAWDDRRVSEPKRAEDCRYTTPSLMMFRGTAAPTATHRASTLKLVFLVGDNPATGPHRAALDRAIVASFVMSGTCEATSTLPPLRVLGPAFSGGAPSLRLVIQQRAELFERVELVSGSASAVDVPQFFEGLAASSAPASALESKTSAMAPTFHRATAAEPDLTCALQDYVERSLSPVFGGEPGPRVALLREGGTAFGADSKRARGPCRFEPLVEIQFPIGIASIREEYEELDRRSVDARTLIARRTSLDLTMRDDRNALNFESDPSDRTNDARDLALARSLASISSMQIQYAAIQATDVADAMFLARKIRDVTPNVRIVFLEANALLNHPSYRGPLLGSLVVSSYPMLGASPFADSPRLSLGVYDSDSSLGVHNAMASLRGAPLAKLRDYLPLDGARPLPVWVSAIGRSGFVPVRLHERGSGGALGDSAPPSTRRTRHSMLKLAPGTESPRLWQVAFVCFACIALLDWLRQAREQMRFEMDKGCKGLPSPVPHSDHDWDLAAIRVKALAQQTVRSFILFGALFYMLGNSWLASDLFAGDSAWKTKLVLASLITAVAFVSAVLRLLQLRGQRADFAQRDKSQESDASKTFAKRVVQGLHFGPLLSSIALLATGFFLLLHLTEFVALDGIAFASDGGHGSLAAEHAMLFALRVMEVASGVSPFAPLAFAALCAYVYALGSTSRLLVAYALANVSPPDGVRDDISTPLAAILFPVGDAQPESPWSRRRKGLLDDEADLVKAVAHPNTESRRRMLWVLIAALPILFMFFLKRPSAIGSWRETALLFSVLTGCAVMTMLVLLYLWEYWRALEKVLKRIMEHPIGHSFACVHAFARDALPEMVSRDPDETLRLAACAQIGATLLRTTPMVSGGLQVPLLYRDRDLETLRARALEHQSGAWSGLRASRSLLDRDRSTFFMPPAVRQHDGEDHSQSDVAALGTAVLTLACRGMSVLERAWGSDESLAFPRPHGDIKPQAEHGAWAATHMLYAEHELVWLRDLETYVATVLALVVGRYVRQFKHFVYASTACGVLLLCAVSSYAFEPRRVLMTCIWLLMAAIVSLTVLVYTGLDRNTLLSHISGSPPNRVTLSSAVIWRGVVWVLLPLLSVFAAQYPDLVNAAYAQFEPLVRALR